MVVVCAGPAWQDVGLRSGFWTAAWASEPQHQLRSVSGQEGVALISVRDRATDVQAMLERALHHVAQHRRDAELVLGVGSVVPRPDLCHESYRQARLTARVALRDTDTGPVARWDRLGVYRFLTQLPQQTIHDAVDPRIAGLVVEHPSFAQTLECYLRHSGSINRVSALLHIHRTTLYYRLDRIRASGIDPADGMDGSTAMASFAALRLLGEWPTGLS
jgi:sugar diacid utilization regulator